MPGHLGAASLLGHGGDRTANGFQRSEHYVEMSRGNDDWLSHISHMSHYLCYLLTHAGRQARARLRVCLPVYVRDPTFYV